MAQWRPLHRRITKSDKVLALAHDHFALWLYTALLPYTDREGRLNANPAGLAATIFEGYGYDSDEIERALHALAGVGLIVLYRNGRYQHLVEYTKFKDMCKPDSREAKSDLPGPGDDGSETIAGSLSEPSPATTTPTPDESGSGTPPLREESAESPGSGDPLHVHVHVHEQVHVQETRAREARAGALEKPPPEKPGKTARSSKARSPTFDPLAVPLPEFVSPDVWADFADHRRALRRQLTPQAVKGILEDLAKHPDDADEMLRTSIKRGWTGVFPIDKDRDKRNRGGGSNNSGGSSALDQYREKGL